MNCYSTTYKFRNEVQYVIDSCRFVSQSNYLNNSNDDCDWLTSADATFTPLENKFGLKIQPNAWGIIGFFIIKQIKKPRPCSVLL